MTELQLEHTQTESVKPNTLKRVEQSLIGLEMLAETKEKSMNTLAEIAIVLNNDKVRKSGGIEDQGEDIYEFLSSIRWLLNSLDMEVLSQIKKNTRNQH